MNPLRAVFAVMSCIGIFFVRSAMGDIAATLHFYPSDFDTATVLAPDSVYYTTVTCALSNQVSVDSESYPALPLLTYSYSLPQGMEVSSVTITSRSQQLLFDLSRLVYPAQTPMLTRIGEPIPPFVPPGSSYSYTLYPADSNIASIGNSLAYSFGMGIGTIQIRPVQYRIPQNELWISTDISINIHLTTASRTPFIALRRSTFAHESIKKYLKSIVQNKSDVDQNLPTPIIDTYNYPVNPQNIPPDYIIITSTAFAQELVALKNWKKVHGIPAEIFTLETDIYPNYSGRDNPEKIRNFIIDKARDGAAYILLAGNRDVVPIRYAFHGNAYSPPPVADQQICDLYYADLNGDWEIDGDGVWGEPTHDSPDLAADIYVGRVAIGHDGEAATWLDKLSNYCEDPGGVGSDAYLANVIISSADQMRDLGEAPVVGMAFDDWFHIDSLTLAEMPNGGDLNPTSPIGPDVISRLSSPSYGYYISLNHGSPDYYAVRTRGYNTAPRASVTTSYERNPLPFDWGWIGNVINECREYVHSSAACDLGGLDCADLYRPEPYFVPTCYAERDLIMEGGSVAGTFNTRWGWCATSYEIEIARTALLCGELCDHILAKAHYGAKTTFGGRLRDLLYGNTFFGDPSMVVWTYDPGLLLVEHPSNVYRDIAQTVTIRVKDSQTQIYLSNVFVTLSKGDEVYDRGLTDVTGRVYLTTRPNTVGYLKIVCTRPNFIGSVDSIIVKTFCDSAVAGDANGNGYCQGGDVTFLQRYLAGTGPHPPDSCMCTESGTFLYHAADANGNCAVQGGDVTYLVAYFKGQVPPPHFCTTCPVPGPILLRTNIIPVISSKEATR